VGRKLDVPFWPALNDDIDFIFELEEAFPLG
jgi:hypothetical protein